MEGTNVQQNAPNMALTLRKKWDSRLETFIFNAWTHLYYNLIPHKHILINGFFVTPGGRNDSQFLRNHYKSTHIFY